YLVHLLCVFLIYLYILDLLSFTTRRSSDLSGYLFRDLLYSNFIGSTSCVMLDKKKLLEVGLFNETLPASQDYELYLRISKKNIINFVDEPLVIYHEHNGERISSNPYK